MADENYLEEIDTQKYWLTLKRRWIPAISVFTAITLLSLVAAFSQKPKYEATAKVLIRPDKSSSIVGLGISSGDDLQALTRRNSPLTTQAEIITSIPIAQKTIKLLDLKDDQGELLDVESFLDRLIVKEVTLADVLKITYEGDTPEEAAKVVNTVVDLYIQNNVTSNRAESTAARDFIASQLPQVESSVQQAEFALRQFKESNSIVSLDDEAKAAVGVISSLDRELISTGASLEKTTSRSQALREELGLNPADALVFATLSQNSGVQKVLSEYQSVQSELASERTRYANGHPAIDSLERRAAALEDLLRQRVKTVVGDGQFTSEGQLQIGDIREQLTKDLIDTEVERLALSGQVNSLVATQTAYRTRASLLPQLQQQQAGLERNLKAAQSTYETLLTRLQELQVSENQNIGNAEIISPALVAEDPTSPNKKLYLATGLAVGFLLSVLTAFLLDLFDQSVKTLKDAKALFNYPLLGVIPGFDKVAQKHFFSSQDEPVPKVVVRDISRPEICDAYQMLRANLKFLTSDKTLRTIIVSSSGSKEGKSTVAANLAATMAQLGHRVLLVDANMRQPTQHLIWDTNNFSGLTNVIVEHTDFRTSIYRAMPNLDLLPSGAMPPNPVVLLDSKQMRSLVEQFSTEYDFVILDTPSLEGTPDAAILGQMSDGILLVVRPGVVTVDSATATREFLQQSGQHVLGLVANGILFRSQLNSGFYHSKEYNLSSDKANISASTYSFLDRK